jgi:hypothetical protein
MNWQQLIVDLFERMSRELEEILDGLTPEELNQQPAPGANTIGWLAWHLTRSHDRNMSEIAGREQLWIEDKWYARFNRAADPAETGVGHSPEEVAAFRAPDSRTILDYHNAVLERIRNYIGSNLSETELDREVYSPTFRNTNAVHKRLLGVLNDGLQHLGQAAYVRGLIKGQGWLGR